MKPSITSKPSRISDGQKQTGIQVVVDALRKAMGVAIDELSDNGVINTENFQRVISQGDKVVAAVTILVKEKIAELAENITGVLKLISGAEVLTLDPTDGKETIAKADDTFPSWIDGDFKAYGCDVKSAPTEERKVSVHEMIKNGDFKAIFGCLSDNLDSLCLTQPQIIQFVKKHRQWLRSDGYATLFLFNVSDDFFVAFVYVHSGGLKVYVDRFSDDRVWRAGNRSRVVVPQQALAS